MRLCSGQTPMYTFGCPCSQNVSRAHKNLPHVLLHAVPPATSLMHGNHGRWGREGAWAPESLLGAAHQLEISTFYFIGTRNKPLSCMSYYGFFLRSLHTL